MSVLSDVIRIISYENLCIAFASGSHIALKNTLLVNYKIRSTISQLFPSGIRQYLQIEFGTNGRIHF
jgi:hypothetical protein